MKIERDSPSTGYTAARLIVVALALVGCTTPTRKAVEQELDALETPWGNPDAVIAKINGKPITRGGFYKRVLKKFGARMIFTGVIKEELFLQEAERLGIAVSDKELATEVDKRLAEESRNVGGRDKLEKIYANEGWTIEDKRAEYADLIREQMIAARVVQAGRKIDDEALRRYYQETYARTRYRVSLIAYKYRDPATPETMVPREKQMAMEKALSAVRQVRDGYDFAEIARNESEDRMTSRNGGDIGVISMEDPLPINIKEAIVDLEEGEISPPIDVADDDRRISSIQIYKLTDRMPRRGFAECRETLIEELQKRFPTAEEMEATLARLSAKADIEVLGRPADLYEAPSERKAEGSEE